MLDKEREILQKEIIDLSPYQPHGRYLLAPRLGKTKIIIDLIKRDNPESILWVTPSKELAETGVELEFSKWKAKKFIKRLTTTTWASLPKITGHFTTIVLDEEQHITDGNVYNILSGDITYDHIVSLTGTKSNSWDKNIIYNKLKLDVIYEYDINQAVESNILQDYFINVIDVPMGAGGKVLAGTKEKPFYTEEKSNYSYLSKRVAVNKGSKSFMFSVLARMHAIYKSPAKFAVAERLVNNMRGRKLIFSPYTETADNLSSNTYHSKTDNKDLLRFMRGDINTLSLVNAGGTGITYTGVEHIIIVQADSDNNGSTSQKISRALLKNKEGIIPIIWIICLKGTEDVNWVEGTLSRFDKDRARYINLNSDLKIISYDSITDLNLREDFPMFHSEKETINTYKK